MENDLAVKLKNVSLIFNKGKEKEREVLKGIDLEIKKGEFISLLGPSGCGKTTLLRIMADLLTPTAGDVEVEGKSAYGARKEHKYGMVFQDPSLLEWRTVMANIALPLEIIKIPKKRRYELAGKYLKLVDLSGYEKAYPHELSGGMKQRVGIARALVTDPDILLMDEPFSALDEFTKEQIHMDLLKIWDDTGKTIVFVTHNIQEAVFLSDRVCIMSPGPARIISVKDIDLVRPRKKRTLKDEDFFNICREIRDEFESTYYGNL